MRAPLFHTNKTCDSDLMEELLWAVLNHFQSRLPNFGKRAAQFSRRFRKTIKAIDSTTGSLMANGLDWAKHRRLNLGTLLPGFAIIEEASHHDERAASTIGELHQARCGLEVFFQQTLKAGHSVLGNAPQRDATPENIGRGMFYPHVLDPGATPFRLHLRFLRFLLFNFGMGLCRAGGSCYLKSDTGRPMSPYWKTDEELFALAKRELFTALVGDVLDRLGFAHQFLPPRIRPLHPDMVVIGRALPVLEADVGSNDVTQATDERVAAPFGLMFHALDDLKRHEVYICTGASPEYALWGGLMSTRAQQLGAAGAVLDGYSRDTPEILHRRFPTFSFGGYAQDQLPRGRVVDFRVPIQIGQVRVVPGDVVFGDVDGVVVVPRAVVRETFVGALEKARGEKRVARALAEGMSAVEAFAKFGLM